MVSEPSSEQSASPSPARSREGRHTCSGQRRVSSPHCVLRESSPASVSPAFSGFMDESVSVPELWNCLQQRVDATLVKSSIQQPSTMSSSRAAREQVTVAEIHDTPHSILSLVQVDSQPTFSQATHRLPTDTPTDTVHFSLPRNYFPFLISTGSDEEDWTRVPSHCTQEGVPVSLSAFSSTTSMWIPVEIIVLREVMGEDRVSYVFKWESSAQLPRFPFSQVTTEEVYIAVMELALLSQLPTPTLHHTLLHQAPFSRAHRQSTGPSREASHSRSSRHLPYTSTSRPSASVRRQETGHRLDPFQHLRQSFSSDSRITLGSRPSSQTIGQRFRHPERGGQSAKNLLLKTKYVVPKRDSDKLCLVVNLSRLNKFIEARHFRMLSIPQVRLALLPGALLAFLDLESAYCHAPVHPRFWKFLAVQVDSKLLQFRVMPFCLNIAPQVFSKLTKVVAARLSDLGISTLIFGRLAHPSSIKGTALSRIEDGNQDLQGHGLLLQLSQISARSNSTATLARDVVGHSDSNCKSLGYKPDPSVEETQTSACSSHLHSQVVEESSGFSQFRCRNFPLGRLRFRRFSLEGNQWFPVFPQDNIRPFPSFLLRLIKWWCLPAHLAMSIPWTTPVPSMVVTTDASSTGWGLQSSEGCQAQGLWTPTWPVFHFNDKELIVALMVTDHSPSPSVTDSRCASGELEQLVIHLPVSSTIFKYVEKKVFQTKDFQREDSAGCSLMEIATLVPTTPDMVSISSTP
ncbi:hypothetical protein Pcinc_016951 [Petrolisthes cinctipes]|uniref:Reverse transcriptase domain-containing protein n=1 Tax=Petrolisthes cinctipes TaxID=88211 RepID=A0AAE1FPZ2_PETCI|nr:hypothetical protein Pcinc_016951 [Petrolisthes cinctipes]